MKMMAMSLPHVAIVRKQYGACEWVLLLVFALSLPPPSSSASLRGLLEQPRSLVHPLPRPPPATADTAFEQLSTLDGVQAPAPAPAPGPMPGPYPAPGPYPGQIQIIMPEAPKLPPITAATCTALTGKICAIVGCAAGGPGPGPGPGPSPGPGPAPGPRPAAAVLLDLSEDTRHIEENIAMAPAPGPGGPGATVYCELYAFETGKAAGCQCFLEEPPLYIQKVNGCPNIPNAISMGFTGGVVEMPSMQFGGETGGWVRQTCFYRQWFHNPTATGVVKTYQEKLADAYAGKYLVDAYAASMRNAQNAIEPMWAMTQPPWLKLYPTTPWPGLNPAAPSPGLPGLAAGPGFAVGMLSTTPPIIYSAEWYNEHFPTTTMMMTTPAFGYPRMTTAPTYAVLR